MANNCKQCFNTHYQPHCHPTTKSLWLRSSVYWGPPHPSRRIMVGGRSRQPKNNMKWRYVVTVVITSHTLITNEIHNWLNRVFMSLLSPLAEPADNESETDGHLTRMGPRLIMNICLIFPGPVFSQCKVANSELLLHNHTCAQLSYCFETSSRQVFHCGGKQCSTE